MSAVATKPSKLPGFFSLILVMALGASLAKLMWLIVAPQDEITINSEASEQKTQVQKKQINYGKLIADQHIFGEVKKKAVVKKEPAKPLKKAVVKTKLNAKLHGIVAYKSKASYALISLNNGPQKVYGKGEKIQEGVVVNDILPEKVILDNRGNLEELLLPKKNTANKAPSSKRSNSFSRANRRAPARTNSLPGSAPAPPAADNNVPNLEEIRQEAIQNPSKLMDVVRPSPAVVDGQFIGFRVQPGRKRKLFRSLGFLPNDIVTEVNGIVLDDQSKGTMVLGELAQAADISIKVKRGKEEVFLQQSF